MKVSLIGACDRNNYGDLIMPVIFKKQYILKNKDKKIKFNVYGQIESDMSYLKSCDTKALYTSYNNCDIAIVVGGEVLSSNYKLMYLNLQKNKLKIFIFRCLNKFFPSKIENFAKKNLKGCELGPWIIDKDKMKCKKLIYNTVGGKNLIALEEKKILKKIDYISIRNKKDYELTKKINNHTYLFPDSMITVSNYINDKDFSKYVFNDIINLTKRNYFIVQINNRDSTGEIKKISKQIDLICEQYKISCILLPIGYAQGHEDQIALKKIKKNCKHNNVYLSRETNIYETTYILKNAQMFIGTSLHGIVISTSYGVPHMVLTNKIKKILDYINTWKSSSISYTDVQDIYNNFKKIYLDMDNERNKILTIKEKMIKLAEENFQNINNIINEVYKHEK